MNVRFTLMKSNRWLGLAALAASVQFLSAADIVGKVTLKGTPPAERVTPMADGFCGPGSKGTQMKGRIFRAAADGGLGDVIVHIKGAPAAPPAEGQSPVLDQKDCVYEPYMVALHVNQQLTVKNSDPVLHNVHTRPTVQGNKEENLAQMPKGKDLVFKFAKPEQFMRVECNVHPWMVSYISIFEHPYFAITKDDGTFVIKNVPKGDYTVEVVHRRAGKAEQKVSVADANATANFTLEVPAAK